MLYGITNELTRCLQSVQRIRGFTTMRYINRLFTYLLTERCRQARDGQHRDAIISRLCSASCTGFMCSSASCSRLRPSSTGPCPATPRVTWPTTVSSSPTPVSDNYVLPTLKHSSAGHAAVLETRHLPPKVHNSGTVCRPISDYVGCHTASSGVYTEDVFIRMVRPRRSVNCF